MRFNTLRSIVASRPEAPLEPIKFEVRRDEAADLWYAVDTGDLGIVTEANTLEELRERLQQALPECFGIEGCPVELELCEAEDEAGPEQIAAD